VSLRVVPVMVVDISLLIRVLQVKNVLSSMRTNPHMVSSTVVAGRVHLCTNEGLSGSNEQLSSSCRGLARQVEKVRSDSSKSSGGGPGCGAACTVGCAHYRALTSSVFSRLLHAAARPPVSGCAQEQDGVTDIEDLRGLGSDRRGAGGCPYYSARALVTEAGLVASPYNYVFNEKIRAAVGMNALLENAIVVVDEAHNAEGVCRDGTTATL
jgi:hypothetical protein